MLDLDKDLYWLVGLLEGKGSFSPPSPSKPNVPKFSIQMTNKDVMERVGCLFRRKIVIVKSKNTNHQDSYVVTLEGIKAVRLMKKLLPFMSKRRKQQITRAIQNFDPFYKQCVSKSRRKISDTMLVDAKDRISNGESLRTVARSFDVHHKSLSRLLV